MQELLDNIKSNHMEVRAPVSFFADVVASLRPQERKNRALLVAKGNKLQKDLNVVEQAMRKARSFSLFPFACSHR